MQNSRRIARLTHALQGLNCDFVTPSDLDELEAAVQQVKDAIAQRLYAEVIGEDHGDRQL